MAPTPVTPTDVSNILIIDPTHLKRVEVGVISEESMSIIDRQIIPKQCYTNALLAALALDGERVVIGATWIERFGIAIEHAWLQMADGTFYDPTLQKLEQETGFKPGIDYQYFSLWSVLLDDYLPTCARLRGGTTDMAIDMLALRTSPNTRHLFNYKRRKVA